MSKEISFRYPFSMGKSQKARYELNGLHFRNKTNKGYTHLSTPDLPSAADFASLSQQDLSATVPHLASTEYHDLIDEAQQIQLLIHQATTVHKDGFPYPSQEKPYTWPLHEKIPHEIKRQLETLKSAGISEVKIGLEMEFCCDEEPLKGFTHWQEIKSLILSDPSAQEVAPYIAREILMYDLLHLEPETHAVLQPLFGIGRDGDGYYDGQGVLELKLKPVDPNTALKNRAIVLKHLYEKVTRYGLPLSLHPNFHVNISFWDESGNLFDDTHPEFSTKGKSLIEGITKAFYDNIFTILSRYEMQSDELVNLNLTADRNSLLRYSSGRVEVRPSSRTNLQDPAIMITTLLAGALYGLSERTDVIPAQKVLTPIIHHTPGQHKVTAHVLSNSIITDDGSFVVPKQYIREKDDTLEYELGLREFPPDQSMATALFRSFFASDHLPYITAFFNGIRVTKNEAGETEIEFPTTNGNNYEYVIPAINMDKIPVEYQRRLEAGEDIENMRADINEYLDIGDRMPKPAQRCSIDTEKLRQSLAIKGFHSKFIVTGYDPNLITDNEAAPEGWSDSAWQRYKRVVNSQCLRQGFSQDFFEELSALTKEVSQNEVPLQGMTMAEIKAALFFKIKDQDWITDSTPKWLIDSQQERGLVEGKDFIKKYIQIEFEDIYQGSTFVDRISLILDEINASQPQLYYYSLNKSDFVNGTADVRLELDPRFLNVLKEVAKLQS